MTQPGPRASAASTRTLTVTWRAIAITAVVLAAAWAFDLFVLRTTHLVPRRGQPAVTPLYAFWEPTWRLAALLFAAAALAFATYAPRLTDPARVSRGRFTAGLFVCACVVPFALFLVRQVPVDFGNQPALFRYMDLPQDAARVTDVSSFLRDYVALMPTLSLHGQHYPPGPAIYLHLWAQVFGDSPAVVGVAVLAAFALGILAAYGALREFATERAARQGALLLLFAPAALDHACTAMDALFMACATGVWWCALRAFRPGAHIGWSGLLGALLLVATCVSFSTFPVGLAVTIFALTRGRRALVPLVVVGAVYVACAWLLERASGFAIWECLHQAREHAERFMGRIIRHSARATWPYRTYGNIVAFLIGAGLVFVPAVVMRIRSRTLGSDPWSVAALLTLAVMTFGPIYYMETERIWIFALPWLSAVVVGSGGLDDASLRRLALAGALQAIVMECLLFNHW